MIEFLTPEIRTQFHLLPIDTQLAVIAEERRVEPLGLTVFVDWADAENSELSIRIDKQLCPVVVSRGHVGVNES